MERIFILCHAQKRMLAQAAPIGLEITALKGKKQYLWCRHCKREHSLDLYEFCRSKTQVYYIGTQKGEDA